MRRRADGGRLRHTFASAPAGGAEGPLVTSAVARAEEASSLSNGLPITSVVADAGEVCIAQPCIPGPIVAREGEEDLGAADLVEILDDAARAAALTCVNRPRPRRGVWPSARSVRSAARRHRSCEQAGDVAVLVFDGVVERARAEHVESAERRAGGHEQSARGEAAEAGGEVQRGRAARVDVVESAAAVQERLDDAGMVLPCGAVQRAHALRVARVGRRAVPQQEVDAQAVAQSTRDLQRAVRLLVAARFTSVLDGCSMIQQERRARNMPAAHCCEQRRRATCAGRADVGTGSDEELRTVHVPATTCQRQSEVTRAPSATRLDAAK